jgi:RND family efflux transporter MFP subunit
VTVGTELGGFIDAVSAREKTPVKKGDRLVSLRADERQTALAEAEAKLAEAEAEVEYQRREYQRRVKATTASQSFSAEIDATRRDYEVAVARKRAAVAAVTQCRSALARTRISSPIDGVTLGCYVQPGEIVPPGSRLVTICDLSQTRIEAEVDEFDAPRIALGAEVMITAEGHVGPPWRGTVEEIPDRVDARTLRPEDPGRPSDTRVLLVKIATDEPLPLKLGQQVEVEIRSKALE